MSYTKKAVRSTILVFFMMILAAGLGYLFRLLLARELTHEEYGLFYAVFALITFLALFRNLGLGEALAKTIPELKIKKDYPRIKGAILFVFVIQLILSFIISMIIFIFADVIAANYFHSPSVAIVLRIMTLAFFLSSIEYMYGFIFYGFQRMDFHSLLDFLRTLIILVTTFFLFKFNKSAIMPAYANVIAYVIVILLYIPLLIKTFPAFFSTRMKFDKKIAKGFVKFGFFISLGSVGFLVLSYADTLLLTYFTDLNQVALYNIAVPIVSLLWYFSRSISIVIYPMSSELWAKKHKDFSKGIELLQKYSFAIIIPVALVMFSFPDIIIRILFGESYVSAQYALQILAIGAIFYTVMNINNNILIAIGKVKQNTIYLLIGAFFNLLFNFILIPLYGIIGAAIATSSSYVLVLILSSLQINKSVKTRLPWFDWEKSLFSGLIFVSVIMFLKKILELNVWVETGICVSAAVITYIALIFILKVVNFQEIKNIVDITLKK